MDPDELEPWRETRRADEVNGEGRDSSREAVPARVARKRQRLGRAEACEVNGGAAYLSGIDAIQLVL
jgi:hypothetical protein